MTSQVQHQIEQQLIQRMLSVPRGSTREATAAAVVKAMRPFLKKPSQHRLTVMMVEALFKFREAVRIHGNRIHIREQMFDVRGEYPFRLTYDQLNNWSKLRFFGLSVHADENPRSGYWLLTDRGGAFLRGEKVVPKKVFTFAGHPISHSPETVAVLEYRSELPNFETYYDFHKPAPKADPQLTLA